VNVGCGNIGRLTDDRWCSVTIDGAGGAAESDFPRAAPLRAGAGNPCDLIGKYRANYWKDTCFAHQLTCFKIFRFYFISRLYGCLPLENVKYVHSDFTTT
jgi:hypothetical protein